MAGTDTVLAFCVASCLRFREGLLFRARTIIRYSLHSGVIRWIAHTYAAIHRKPCCEVNPARYSCTRKEKQPLWGTLTIVPPKGGKRMASSMQEVALFGYSLRKPSVFAHFSFQVSSFSPQVWGKDFLHHQFRPAIIGAFRFAIASSLVRLHLILIGLK